MSGSEESDKSAAGERGTTNIDTNPSTTNEGNNGKGVSLPSIFTNDDLGGGARRASLPTLRHAPYPNPHVHIPAPPLPGHPGGGGYYDSPASTTSSNYSFGGGYDDYRGGSGSPAPYYPHAASRISGHQPPQGRPLSAGMPKSNDWAFPPAPDPAYMLPGAASGGYHHPGPYRSPGMPNSVPSSTLVDRPQRKRGKLPKETTDFLKAWLHRHADHPYPSEEEKKQLCHATGLSMSQVSNWMINARRRILAPAHRAAQSPTTNAPFGANSRASLPGGGLMGDPLAGGAPHLGRRASMPTDGLQIYQPMTLQSMPSTPTSHPHPGPQSDYMGQTRHMLGMPPASPPMRGLTGPGGSYPAAGDYSPPSRLGQLYMPPPNPGASNTPTSAASSTYLATPVSSGPGGGGGSPLYNSSPSGAGPFDDGMYGPGASSNGPSNTNATNGEGNGNSNPGSAYGTPHPQ
ncbi:hypothetical protein DL96DRAFT_144732 [Flagelloscypha sp. PMI_526]|nr:hypothetical protein DL96DRAFT_377310 [Flagelloscypha sp. PMI_526]KAH8824799.1 hypothetical protein DL96DRAFT_144732 [Flagelloscypha sp. PMI_526]